ncbi:MAG: hypothetical protein AABW67_06015 [Nanoarchaeota archaeon]
MKNKNLQIFALILFSLLILNLFLISIKADSPSIPSLPGIGGNINPDTGLPIELEKIQEIGKNLTSKEISSNYLKQEWNKILLDNKYISSMDSFFTKISIIFRILFGIPYSLTLTLFFVIILWFAIFLSLPGIIENSTSLSSGVSWLISLGITIILAQIQVLNRIIVFLIKFISYPENSWLRLLVGILIFVGIIIFYYIEKYLSKYLEKKKKQKIENKTKQTQKKIEKFSEGAGI